MGDSFDRPPGQEQPSLLDYSQEQTIGTVSVSGTIFSGGVVVAQGMGGGDYDSRSSCVGGGLPRLEGSVEGFVLGDHAQNDSYCCISGTEHDADDNFNDVAHTTTKHTATSSTTCTATGNSSGRTTKEDGLRGAQQSKKSASPTGKNSGSRLSAETQRNGDGGRDFLHQQRGERAVGRVEEIDGIAKLEGIVAKVKTRRSPRRKLPGYLSASPDGFGAASRWGALSKAHLEFHRLGTAGEHRELGRRRLNILFLLVSMVPLPWGGG